MNATITRQPREVSVRNPLPGRIKFFKAEKLFGFIETSEGDLFFGTRGYRRVRGLGDGKIVVQNELCPTDALESGLSVLVLDIHHGSKGGQAVEWTIPSLNNDETSLWVVIQRIERITEREVTSEPVCDNERRMFKTHTTRRVDTFINEKIAATCPTKAEAEQYVESTMSASVREYRRSREGTGTQVSFRIERINLA